MDLLRFGGSLPPKLAAGTLRFSYGIMGDAARSNRRDFSRLTIARVIRIVFGVLAGLMLVAALGDIVLFGQLTIVSPVSFGALLAVALAFLINKLLTTGVYTEILER